MSQAKIRVLIVDDSAVVRQTLSEVLSSDPAIEVIGTASDPFVAAERMQRAVPDVITAGYRDAPHGRPDVPAEDHEPAPDSGDHLFQLWPKKGRRARFKALEYGAVDIIAKPRLGTKQFLEESRVILCQAVKARGGAPG